MRFLAIDRNAVVEITADRLTQSPQHDAGQALAALLLNLALDVKLGPKLALHRNSDGVFIVGAQGAPASADFVVFDLDTCDLFGVAFTTEEAILCLQKVLRFALKRWNNLHLSPSERILPESTKAIIFPYPISRQTSFRISIELSPDERRQSRRSPHASHMLVYRSGTDEGGGPQEGASSSNFRRFLEARAALPANNTPQAVDAQGITSLSVTSLDQPIDNPIAPFQGYRRWIELLTHKQNFFVMSELKSPHRIEGPAGTGKTLCLVLKAIYELKEARKEGSEHHALFITHSEATRRAVENLIHTNDPHSFLSGKEELRPQWLRLTTLHQLCASLLQKEIGETEFLDRDAMESKQLQLLYVAEALREARNEDYPTHKGFLSQRFDSFLNDTDGESLGEMFQHEISVVIKGRAEEDLEHYKKLPRLRYGLPTETTSDRGLVWNVFKRYQRQLQDSAQFDTDDIVLTTIGQMDTPIWRRRRAREGYDSIYIDETHLFNINELSLFHHLSRSATKYPIAYSVDRSQAIGDRGWSDALFEETLSPSAVLPKAETRVGEIFRCSPEIVDLAFSVTSAGATLFTNFDDPLKLAASMFTVEDESRARSPRLLTSSDDDAMVSLAFQRAEALAEDLKIPRSGVAIIAFSQDLFRKAQDLAVRQNKPLEIVKQRGDVEAVERARRTSRFVLSLPEYIGGLEFEAVILLGVDEGRVPPSKTTESIDSSNFLSYSAHNQLYVSITRARYRLEILVSKDRGASSLLENALQNKLLRQG